MKLKALGLVGLWAACGNVHAAGFALYEHSVSALGTGFAGQAVMAQDASTMFANPAGLTEIKGGQFVVGGTLIKSSAKFSDGTGGDAGGTSLVPSMYLAMDIRSGLKLGFGLYSPFGLKTEYDTVWTGSSQGIKSEMKTVDFNPTLAWQANDRLSLGLGLDYQYIDATLTNSAGPLGVATMTGDDTAWGYNLGLMYRFDEATRLGLSYRSRIKHHLTGSVDDSVHALPGPLPLPQAIYADVTLPDMAMLAVQHDVNDKWTILADATWTGWSSFKDLTAKLALNDATVSSTRENWKNVWRFGLGTTYKSSDALMWRFGVAYDNTPIPDTEHRYARIPDSDRISVAIGARYVLTPRNRLDVGYMHLFFKDGPTNSPLPTGGTLAGTFKGHADILGVQLTHNL